jgi:hypothetical protein
MNITLPPLDAEQQSALTQLVQLTEDYKTEAEWASAVLLGLINEQVLRNINAKGAQLLEAAKQLPKEKRLDFTTQAEALLTTIATS